jgi:membrane-associated phospholipid phosphatase
MRLHAGGIMGTCRTKHFRSRVPDAARDGQAEILAEIEKSPRRALLALAVTSAVLLVPVYLVAVQTRWGQRLDATALRGRRGLARQGVNAAGRLLTTIDVASLALLGGAIVLVALLRARPRLGVGAFVLIAGSILTAKFLKHVALPRPFLGVRDGLTLQPTWPSGHTAVAMSLAVGAMIVSPIRWRVWVGLLGAGFAAAIGAAVVATGGHRPSDPIGSALVVTAWSAVVLAYLVGNDREHDEAHRRHPVIPWFAFGGLVLLVVAFLAAVATAFAIHRHRLDTIEIGGAYVGATSAIVGAIFLGMGALLMILRGIDLDA